MFTNDQFKSLLIKTLERKSSSNYYEGGNEIVSKMKISEVTLDETNEFTYYKGYKRDWNTLCTYLKIRAPFDDLDFFLKVIKICLPRQQAPYMINKVIMY